jgi:hypothetical protein
MARMIGDPVHNRWEIRALGQNCGTLEDHPS